jgi:mono/diheme cytochrome c family protein
MAHRLSGASGVRGVAKIAATLAAAAALAGCTASGNGNAQEAQKAAGPPPTVLPPMEKAQGPDVTSDSSRLAAAQDGEHLFLRRCGVCHLEGGMGTQILARRMPANQAKLQDRIGLTPDFVIHTARNGMGAMPRISRVEATDAELAAIAAYLSRRR